MFTKADPLITTFEAMQPGEHYCFDHCTVTIMASPLCGRYKIVGQMADQVRFTDSAVSALDAVDEFQDHPMPVVVEARRQSLLTAASSCYKRRDWEGESERADDFEVIGDVYFAQARALLAEWTA